VEIVTTYSFLQEKFSALTSIFYILKWDNCNELFKHTVKLNRFSDDAVMWEIL